MQTVEIYREPYYVVLGALRTSLKGFFLSWISLALFPTARESVEKTINKLLNYDGYGVLQILGYFLDVFFAFNAVVAPLAVILCVIGVFKVP